MLWPAWGSWRAWALLSWRNWLKEWTLCAVSTLWDDLYHSKVPNLKDLTNPPLSGVFTPLLPILPSFLHPSPSPSWLFPHLLHYSSKFHFTNTNYPSLPLISILSPLQPLWSTRGPVTQTRCWYLTCQTSGRLCPSAVATEETLSWGRSASPSALPPASPRMKAGLLNTCWWVCNIAA